MADTAATIEMKPRKRTNSWWWMRADVDLGRLPATVDLSMKPVLKLALTGTILFVSTAVIPLIVRNTDNWNEVLVWSLLAVGTFLAANLAGILFFAFRKRRRITFDSFKVTVERMGLFGSRSWSLPYTDYEGVLHREAQVSGIYASLKLQIIELYHRDPDKTVPLYVQEAAEAPREKWKAYAQRLKLPALTDQGDDAAPKSMEETLRAIRTIVSEDAAAAATATAFDIAAPPKGLVLLPDTIDGDAAERVAITKGRVFKFVYIMLLASPILLIATFLYFDRLEKWLADPPWSLIGLLVLGFVLPLYLWLSDRRKKRGVVVSRTRLLVDDMALPEDKRRRTFRLREIEEVRVKAPVQGIGKVLLVAGRSEQVEIGFGLSKEALNWLRDYIIAAVVRAPA